MKTIVVTRKMNITYDASSMSRHEYDSSDFKKEVPDDFEVVSQAPQITVNNNELYVSYAFVPKGTPKTGSGLGATIIR